VEFSAGTGHDVATSDEPAYGEVQRMLEAAPRYGIEFVG